VRVERAALVRRQIVVDVFRKPVGPRVTHQ
jgi:hypothetical protein